MCQIWHIGQVKVNASFQSLFVLQQFREMFSLHKQIQTYTEAKG